MQWKLKWKLIVVLTVVFIKPFNKAKANRIIRKQYKKAYWNWVLNQ